MDSRVKIIDLKIDKALAERRHLEKENEVPSIIETSESVEFRELKSRRRFHGPIPEWMLKFDAFEWWIYDAHPIINPDLVKKEAYRLHLLDKLKRKQKNQKVIRQLLVASIFCFAFVFLVPRVGSDNHSSLDIEPQPNIHGQVFVDNFSGNSTGAPDFDHAQRALLARSSSNETIISVTRWGLDNDSHLICEILYDSDSVTYFRSAHVENNDLSQKLGNFLQTQSTIMLNTFERGTLPFFETEVKTIEGMQIVFKKWEARTPAGLVSYWKGVPLNHPETYN